MNDMLMALAATSNGAASPLAGASGSGDLASGGAGDGSSFVAALAELLGPLVEDGDHAALEQLSELAGAAAASQDAEASPATVWPLALLLDAAAAAEEPTEQPGLGTHLAEADGAETNGAAAAAELVADLLVAGATAGTATQTSAADAALSGSTTTVAEEAGSPLEGAEVADGSGEDAAELLDGGPDETSTTTSGAPTLRAVEAPSRPGEAATAVPTEGEASAEVALDADGPSETDTSAESDAPEDALSAAPRSEVRQASASDRVATDELSVEEPAPASGSSATARSSAPTGTTGMSDGVRRVLEAVELLEQSPPPRQMTIEVGEGRLRVSLEQATVRLTILDGSHEDLQDLLQTAEEALSQHGFDLGGDRRGGGEPSDDDTPSGWAAPGTARTTRAPARGLRL